MIIRYLLLIICVVLNVSCQKDEKLLIAGCGWNKIAILDKNSGTIEWEHEFTEREDCNDIEMTDAGNILFAYRGGARLIDRNHKVLWDYKVKKGEELYTATEISEGGYMLAVCGNPSRIIYLDSSGQFTSELKFDSGISKVHSQFRQIQKLDNGNYLIPLMGKGEIVELTKNGEIIKRVKCGGNPFSLCPMDDDKWLVSCGDAHNLIEIDWTNGSIVRVIDDNHLSEGKICFAAEAVQLNDGNLLFCNWNGHTSDKTQPLLIEIDNKGNVKWKIYPSPEIVNISAVYPFSE